MLNQSPAGKSELEKTVSKQPEIPPYIGDAKPECRSTEPTRAPRPRQRKKINRGKYDAGYGLEHTAAETRHPSPKQNVKIISIEHQEGPENISTQTRAPHPRHCRKVNLAKFNVEYGLEHTASETRH